MDKHTLQTTVLYSGGRFHDISTPDTKVDLSNPAWMVDLAVELSAHHAKGMEHCLSLPLGKMKNLSWFYFGQRKDILKAYTWDQTYIYLLDQFSRSQNSKSVPDPVSDPVSNVENKESDNKRSASTAFEPPNREIENNKSRTIPFQDKHEKNMPSDSTVSPETANMDDDDESSNGSSGHAYDNRLCGYASERTACKHLHQSHL
jgi:hypothetical protein